MKKYTILFVFAVSTLLYACGGEGNETTTQKESAQQEIATVDGSKVWKKNCIACHGAFGDMGVNGAKDLGASELTLEERIQVITKGRNTMMSYEAILSPEEIEAAAKHTLTFGDD